MLLTSLAYVLDELYTLHAEPPSAIFKVGVDVLHLIK